MYEQALVDRRRWLVWALQASVGTLALPGCGGSGDSGADAPPAEPVPNNGIVLVTTAVSGTIQMPAGATAMPVTAGNLFSQEPVNGTLGFALTLIQGNRILTTANGPAGGPLLVGLLKEGRAVISPETTAVVVAFMALGAPMQVEAVQSLILEELEKPGVVAGLSGSIAAAIVARGEQWLDFNDAALRQALGSVLSGFRPPAEALREKPLGAIVEPTTRVSGLQVNADGAGSAVIANYYRRRVYAYVDRVSYTDKQGRTTASKGVVGTQPIKLGAVKGLNTALLTLVDVAAGNKDYYDPVYSDAFEVPVFGEDAVSTEYSIATVGLAGTKGGEFDSLTQLQQEGWKEVALQSLVLDLVVPAITNIVLPIAGESIDSWARFFGASAVAKEFIAALALRDEIITKIRDGNVSEAIADTYLFFVNSESLRNAFLELFLDWVYSGFPGTPKTRIDRFAFAKGFTSALLKALSNADIAFQAFDTAVALTDLSRAQPASIFTLEVTNAIAALNPSTAQTDSIGVPIVFTAAVTNADLAAGTVLSYTWETTGQFGNISDGLPEHTGKSFESSRAVLSYAPNGKGKPGDTDTVKVKVYKGGINGRIPIGEAVSTVSYKRPYSLSISPAGTAASPTEVPSETSFGITAFINEALPVGTTVAWQWSHAGVGSVSASPADSNPTDSDVTFVSALDEGASTVTARATVKVPASASTPALSFDTDPISTVLKVKKGLREITMQVFGGVFDCFVAAACGVNNYTAFVVPKFAKAIQYKAVLTELGVGSPYYDSIGNTQTRYWTGQVGDGGGINFPITDHPHGVPNTKAWAVWISFGGPINGKCMVTITLQP